MNEEIYKLQLRWKEVPYEITTEEIQLHQNRPNPWDEETIIPFESPEPGEVTLQIINALGEKVAETTKEYPSGKQQIKLINQSWPPGLYYYTLRYGDIQLTKTMLILSKH